MAALRERQRSERDRRILAAATRLFGQIGYDQASMEAIADRAQVSKGTLYNYYKSKGDILLAIVTSETINTRKIGVSIISDDTKTAQEAVMELIDVYVSEPMKLLSKETLRRAVAMSIQQPDSLFGQRYAEADRELGNQLVELVSTLSRRGQLLALSDPTALGEVLFNNVNMMFTLFMIDEEMDLNQLKERLTRQTATVLGTLAPGDRKASLDQ